MTQAYSKPERQSDPQVRGNVVYIPTALGTRVRFAIITLARYGNRQAEREDAG